MAFRFVCPCFAQRKPEIRFLWQHVVTNIYYLSKDFPENDEFEKPALRFCSYPLQVYDVLNQYVWYEHELWVFNLPLPYN